MALPISEFLTYVKILTILADLIVNDAMHYVNTWRHLWEGKWNRQAHVERLVGSGKEQRNAMVLGHLRPSRHRDVREELVDLL